MTNIGETLRAARNEKKLTIDDVVETTRIRAHFIEALEENNFDALGGDVYLRGFLRNYAIFLGLEAKSLLSQVSTLEDPIPVREPSEPRYLADPLESSPWPIGQIFGTILVIALFAIVFVWWWWRPPALMPFLEPIEVALQFSGLSSNVTTRPSVDGEENATPTVLSLEESPTATVLIVENSEAATPSNRKTATPEATIEEAEEVATKEAEEVTPTEAFDSATPTPSDIPEATSTSEASATAAPTDTPEATATSEATPTAESTENAISEGVIINAQVLADTWVRISLDDQNDSVVQQTIHAGESYDWIGAESVTLRAGNAAALSLTLNGQNIGVLGASGEVIERRWERNPDGGVPLQVQ